jgi:phospholipase/carboxylesterase
MMRLISGFPSHEAAKMSPMANLEGVVRQSAVKRATMILMHGLGSNEHDMYGLACELDPEIEVVCLRAPLPYGPGFAWFEIDWTPQGLMIDETGYWQSVDMLASILPSVGTDVIVGGFSQGAMMTVGLMLKHPHLFSRAVLLSGQGLKLPITNFGGRVFQAHGLEDDVISYAEGEELRNDLSRVDLEFHAYPMGHTVSVEEVRDLSRWLKA